MFFIVIAFSFVSWQVVTYLCSLFLIKKIISILSDLSVYLNVIYYIFPKHSVYASISKPLCLLSSDTRLLVVGSLSHGAAMERMEWGGLCRGQSPGPVPGAYSRSLIVSLCGADWPCDLQPSPRPLGSLLFMKNLVFGTFVSCTQGHPPRLGGPWPLPWEACALSSCMLLPQMSTPRPGSSGGLRTQAGDSSACLTPAAGLPEHPQLTPLLP